MPFETGYLPATRNVKHYANYRCDNCNELLVPDSANRPEPEYEEKWEAEGGAPVQSTQFSDVLHIHLEGGYGEFIDTAEIIQGRYVFANHSTNEWTEPEPGFSQETTIQDYLHLMLCSKCAIKLCEAFPCFKQRVERFINAGVGHHCDKRDGEFVWEDYWECCREDGQEFSKRFAKSLPFRKRWKYRWLAWKSKKIR